MSLRYKSIILLFFMNTLVFSQEGLPLYSDYLSDNYYLIFPSMAGAANCHKVRLTARKQWMGQNNAPGLQTLSYNGKVGERSGIGAIVYNDINGYHSQFGMKATYAHHILFSRDEVDLNQLSFGVNLVYGQSQLDQSTFGASGGFDPAVANTDNNYSYFDLDIGASYNFLDFSFNAVVKNILRKGDVQNNEIKSDNLRKFVLSGAYVFGDPKGILWEPSLLYQYADQTRESALDVNMKAYKSLNFGQLWAGLSYRRSFDELQTNISSSQRLQYVTPIVGLNYKAFMFAYTYTHLLGDVQFERGGFHQLTLGFNFLCAAKKYDCNCPAVN